MRNTVGDTANDKGGEKAKNDKKRTKSKSGGKLKKPSVKHKSAAKRKKGRKAKEPAKCAKDNPEHDATQQTKAELRNARALKCSAVKYIEYRIWGSCALFVALVLKSRSPGPKVRAAGCRFHIQPKLAPNRRKYYD